MSDFPSKTYLALDFGTKKIGSAVGQTITQTARPLQLINYVNGEVDFVTLSTLIKTWRPHGLVLGLPLNMDGTEQPLTERVRAFAKALELQFNLPIHFIDERLTTIAAREEIFARGGYKALQKNMVDNIAAVIMLESWLKGGNHSDAC